MHLQVSFLQKSIDFYAPVLFKRLIPKQRTKKKRKKDVCSHIAGYTLNSHGSATYDFLSTVTDFPSKRSSATFPSWWQGTAPSTLFSPFKIFFPLRENNCHHLLPMRIPHCGIYLLLNIVHTVGQKDKRKPPQFFYGI